MVLINRNVVNQIAHRRLSVLWKPVRFFILFARLGDVIAFDPFHAIGTDLFFPDGNDFLQAVNAVARGIEDARVTVSGCAGD